MKLWKLAFRVGMLASLLCFFALGFHGERALAEGPFHIVQKWTVGGAGGWDYMAVDPVSGHLYITRGNHVLVLDTKTGKRIGDITGLHGTHCVVFDAYGNEGYISDGGGNQVAVFNRRSNRILKTLPAGTNPDGMVFDPKTRTVWAFNGRSHSVTIIDAKSETVAATWPLPGKPEFPVADGKGSIFDNIEDKSEILHFDAQRRVVLATWPLAPCQSPPCQSPSGLAIDRLHEILFAVCDNNVMAVVDAKTGKAGKIAATPAIGDGPDAAAFSPKDHYAFSSNGGSGTMTVVREDAPNRAAPVHFSVLENLATQKGARTMALDPDGQRVYLVTADFGPRPAPTPENPRPRPPILPETFVVLVASQASH